MHTSYETVKTCLSNIDSFIEQATAKQTLSTRPLETTPSRLSHELAQCCLAFLLHPEDLDLLIEAAPKFETYRGKGSKRLNKILLSTFQAIVSEITFGPAFSDSFLPTYSEQNKTNVLSKIARVSLTRTQGDGKATRSHRAALLRQDYWEILADLTEEVALPETLAFAKTTALNEKSSLPERTGAIQYLLTQCHDEEASSDAEVQTIVNKLRDNPPSRDILFQILNHDVNSGDINEMGALFQLEDFDELTEKNDS